MSKYKYCGALVALVLNFNVNAAQEDNNFGRGMSHWTRAQCSSENIVNLDFVESGSNGWTSMCAKRDKLTAKIRTKDLVPGNAYTVWWVYFDNQADNETKCVGGFPDVGVCGFADFEPADPESPNPVAVFGRLGSAIASKHGNASFRGDLNGMRASSGSEVWLLMFGHGPAALDDGRQLARQLLTPEDPNAGFPHLGVDPNGYPVMVTVHSLD